MHHLAPLIYDLAIMLGLAAIALILFQRIHQPVVLGYIIAGIVAGPYTPPYELLKDIPNIQILSSLGVIFLMFTLGLEFSFRKFTRVGASALVTGFIEVVLMLFIGYAVGMWLGWSYYDSLFLGGALSISSTTIIIKAMDEMGLMKASFAELIFGVLIVEDLLAILLLVALSTIVVTQNVLSMEMLVATFKLVMVVGGWFMVGYFFVPTLFRGLAKYVNEETLTIISVSLCLLLVCAATYFDYSSALGAFIMGSILAETVVVHRIATLMRPVRDIFGALFFLSVGMLIDPKVILNHWSLVLGISLITILGKILTATFGAILTGQNPKTAVRVGFGMAQIGEFSFIIAALGSSMRVTSDMLYPLVVAVSVVTTFTTPYLIRVSGLVGSQIEKHLPTHLNTFLKNYDAWIKRAQASSKEKGIFTKKLLRLVANGIMVAIIFTLVDNNISANFPRYDTTTWINNLTCLLISLLFAAPFIWGMTMSYWPKTALTHDKFYLNPSVLVGWLAAFAEVGILMALYFHSYATVGLFILASIIFFKMAYVYLDRYYVWLEQQLMENVKSDEDEKGAVSEAQVELKTVLLGRNHPFVGKTLVAARINEAVRGMVVGMEREGERKWNPDPTVVLKENDLLIIVGEVERIHALKVIILG